MDTCNKFAVRGKQIYVEKHGADHLPKLLYLHGGPGSGCYDFTYYQYAILSESVQCSDCSNRPKRNRSFGRVIRKR